VKPAASHTRVPAGGVIIVPPEPPIPARAHALKDLRTFFNWCIPKYLQNSPAASFKMPKYANERPSHDQAAWPGKTNIYEPDLKPPKFRANSDGRKLPI